VKQPQLHGRWVIVLSFIVALSLTIVPMPDWAAPLRPEWVVVVLIFWCLAVPQRVSVGTAWFCGLLLDVLRGAVLGQHALTLSLVAYVTIKLHRRIRVYPRWQQSLAVLALVLLHQLPLFWVNGMMGVSGQDWSYWLPALSSALLWPIVYPLLRDLQQRFRVV